MYQLACLRARVGLWANLERGKGGVVGCEMEAKVGLWWDGAEERRGEQGVLVGLVLLEVVGRGRGRGERCGADRLREKDVVDGAVCRCA